RVLARGACALARDPALAHRTLPALPARNGVAGAARALRRRPRAPLDRDRRAPPARLAQRASLALIFALPLVGIGCFSFPSLALISLHRSSRRALTLLPSPGAKRREEGLGVGVGPNPVLTVVPVQRLIG